MELRVTTFQTIHKTKRGILFSKNPPFHTLSTVISSLCQVIVIVVYSSRVHPFGATFLSIDNYQPALTNRFSLSLFEQSIGIDLPREESFPEFAMVYPFAGISPGPSFALRRIKKRTLLAFYSFFNQYHPDFTYADPSIGTHYSNQPFISRLVIQRYNYTKGKVKFLEGLISTFYEQKLLTIVNN